jgi:hypothetical protein
MIAGAVCVHAEVPQAETPSPDDRKGMLAMITGSALRYQGEVPDFTCTELITRSEASSHAPTRWKQRDTIEEVLSFVDGHENHTLIMVNGKPTRYTHDSLSGMRSDGLLQFVMVPSWIFGMTVKTRFDWVRWEMMNGRRVAVFTFQVPPSISTKPLVNQSQSFLVGYHGLIFADPDSGEMARLEAWMDAPPDFPFQEDTFVIEYGKVHISGEDFLLPVKASGHVRDGKLLAKNEIEFSNYRKYEADVTVTFGDPSQP